jgi:Na+/phosphate symporter
MERHVVPSAVTSVLALLGAALGAALLAWLVLGDGWETPAAIGAGTVLGLTLATARQNRRAARC